VGRSGQVACSALLHCKRENVCNNGRRKRSVDWLATGLFVLAGIGAGIIGSGAGLASLISYPALLALGVPPVAANVSNTVALTCSALGALFSSRPELRPQRRRVIRFAIAGVLGGVAGAGLLLTTPAHAFERLVPWLVALASLALLTSPWLRQIHAKHLHESSPLLFILVALVATYGGYFGAAAGVLLLATFAAVLTDPYRMINALKNIVLGAANIAASVIFVFVAPVNWRAAIPLAVGCLIGSSIGPPIVRRLPETPLRLVVGLAGLALAVKLFLG
jgi:uncharacterized membrane protein YfcA